MPRRPHSSQQALILFRALAAAPGQWRHGVSLTRETGLKPGTLYPMLIRLNRDGYLESRWEEPERPGRPPRHAYKLTASGCSLSAERLATRSIFVGQPA